MKHIATTATAIALTTTSAFAGAIDRSGQFLDPLFQKGGETGQYVQLSFGQVDPRASSAVFDDPLQSFSSVALAYKAEFNDRFSFAAACVCKKSAAEFRRLLVVLFQPT